MTDREMVELLRNYAKAHMNERPFNLNYGIALMIANRMEQLIEIAEKSQNNKQDN